MKICAARFLRCIVLLFVAALAINASAFAQAAKLAAAETAIEQRIARSGADVAVFFKTLDGNAAWSVAPDGVFHAASTMKVPVMIELFHQFKQGKLELSDKIVVKKNFTASSTDRFTN